MIKMKIALLFFFSILSIAYSELICNGENEVLSEFTSICPLTCGSLGKPRCMAGPIRKPSCQCSGETVRDTSFGKCVKPKDCPKPEYLEELLCNGENEHLSETTPGCPQTCKNRRSFGRCLVIIEKPSCQCNSGTIRDTVNAKCVVPEECPQ